MIRILPPPTLVVSALVAGTFALGSPAPARAQTPLAPVTVTFESTSIRDVIAFFADYADRSIVLGGGVAGTVTAEIQRQPWDVALQAILRAQGLYAQELESGIILVQDPGTMAEAPPPVTTRVFRLSYTPAAELQPVVQAMLSEVGTASVLTSINALVVTDAPDVLDRVAALLR
jgi:type II secretory pathway component GspD/PulD (secretin)